MNFDHYGNLAPYEAIDISLDGFQEFFVIKMKNSSTRLGLFEKYTEHLDAFKRQITPDFLQFINGSYVTKKLNPNDLDLVIFIDYRVYELHQKELAKFKRGGSYQGIEAFIEKAYPPEHPYFVRYQSDLLYWNELFTRDRKQRQKGYLKIQFGHAHQ